ncbi:MAG: nitrous oxide reductase family maturation protein NosD [Rhodobacterales bacterium]|nr:nitrous oxide reductase family maturation protein NosD [Rhodobacterales bacterium]
MLRALVLLFVLTFPAFAGAEERAVPVGQDALVNAIKTAQAGDILRLSKGTYYGPVTILVPLTLIGNDTVIDGRGIASVITVNAENVTLRGLTVIGSGSSGGGLDAGIKLTKTARGAVVEDNRVLGNLVGIDVHGAKDALVARNIIEGRQDRRMNARGNGIYVWNAPGVRVIGNDVRWGRDEVFVNTSKNNEFIGNRFRDLRFAVHYMYANNSVVAGNISEGNHLGFAIMYSDNVRIEGNMSTGDRDHGIMMNYTNKSTISGNIITSVKHKCVFIYNAHKNEFSGNRFEGCETGIHFTAGSERNQIIGNAFVGNRTQVKYVGSKWVNWSADGVGNYWSDHSAFDLDGDGIADSAYRPNDIMDHVLWTQPAAKALLGSPAVQLIRWSQSAFPAMLPGGVIDRAPLMEPIYPEIPVWKEIQ